MNSIMIFENPEFGRVRTMKDEKEEPWFVGSDIAKALGYRDAFNMIRNLDDDEKDTQNVSTPGGKQAMTVINESGLYHAILLSRLESAKKFRKWVTSVVLPQIRRTGGYIPIDKADDDKTIMAKALKIAARTIEEQAALLAAQEPDVMFAQAISAVDNDVLVRDLAKLITENGYPIGQQRLFFWLRQHHYLFQHENRPRQEWVERGLFRISASLIETHHGNLEAITTRVTGKGQQYFIDGFKSGRFVA